MTPAPPDRALPQVPRPEGYRLRDVQLEMSLKPFYDNSPETRRAVCREIFTQWHALCRHAESVSIMLWTADGSEMLEYDGDLQRPFEWARYQGSANPHEWKINRKKRTGEAAEPGVGSDPWDPAQDPEGRGLHRRPYLYRPAPAEFNFTWLRELVDDLKRIGREVTGKTIYVGNTFDIGPEFAYSRFKYHWHPEILAGGNSLFKGQWVSCEAVLNADDRRYAAYPDGIPQGTPLGTFMGRQMARFFADIGFDFLWFSNGFGFALEPWAMIGNLFDGASFRPERADDTRQRILRFWRDLRAEFPARYRIRTRGTNLCTGVDLGSDASPLRDIYHPVLAVDAPVNSPWAALDADFGLELSGWMSHIARHPGETFRFRYYIHDPWWKNSPYLDRYERNPHDIFLPSAVSRIRADGSTEIARDFALLTIDDSDGCMPLSVPAEVTAHLLRAREFAPDDAGPLVWLYPFDAFHDQVLQHHRPDLPFSADFFIGTVINDSVPLNTVMDLADLPAAVNARPALVSGRTFLSPVPRPGSAEEAALLALVKADGDLLIYGPLPPASPFVAMLGIDHADAIEGDFDLDLRHIPRGENMHEVGLRLRHTGFMSAGGWTEAPAASRPTTAMHLATARPAAPSAGREGARVAAALADTGNGRIAWVRASLSTAEYDPNEPEPIRGPILRPLDRRKFFPFGRLARFCLDALGWTSAVADPATANRPPYLVLHRHKNAVHYSGYHIDEQARLMIRHPLGAPVFTWRRVRIIDGQTEVTGQRAWSNEARVFVTEGGDGSYRAKFEGTCGFGVNRRLIVSGCRNATLHFLVEPDRLDGLRILRNPVFPHLVGDFVEPVMRDTPFGPTVRVENVEGSILFQW